jgi:hypothetical protein
MRLRLVLFFRFLRLPQKVSDDGDCKPSRLVSVAERGKGGGRRPGELKRELLAHAPTRVNARAYLRDATSAVIDANLIGD